MRRTTQPVVPNGVAHHKTLPLVGVRRRRMLSLRRTSLGDVNTIAAYAQDMSEFLMESIAEMILTRRIMNTVHVVGQAVRYCELSSG